MNYKSRHMISVLSIAAIVLVTLVL